MITFPRSIEMVYHYSSTRVNLRSLCLGDVAFSPWHGDGSPFRFHQGKLVSGRGGTSVVYCPGQKVGLIKGCTGLCCRDICSPCSITPSALISAAPPSTVCHLRHVQVPDVNAGVDADAEASLPSTGVDLSYPPTGTGDLPGESTAGSV